MGTLHLAHAKKPLKVEITSGIGHRMGKMQIAGQSSWVYHMKNQFKVTMVLAGVYYDELILYSDQHDIIDNGYVQ